MLETGCVRRTRPSWASLEALTTLAFNGPLGPWTASISLSLLWRSLFFFISSDLVVQAVQMVRGPVSWGQTVDRFSADVVLPLVRARGLPIGLGTGVGLRFGPGSPGSAPHQAADCN